MTKNTQTSKEIDLLSIIPPHEGEITLRYGKIGQGKTYGATVDVLDELKRGHIVYVNWNIDFKGFDQKNSLLHIVGSLMFPWKKTFVEFPSSNLRKITVDSTFHQQLAKITDASIYLDEGHVMFDSYQMAKMPMEQRINVLHTRHFDRSINIISQRSVAVHRVMRANVNRFYKYQKLIHMGNFILFRRLEFQDMADEDVDETEPDSVKLYLAKPSIFKMYNSKYLRGDAEKDKTRVNIANMNYLQKIKLLYKWCTTMRA